jgi:outer membrane lipoprotein carrier protein
MRRALARLVAVLLSLAAGGALASGGGPPPGPDGGSPACAEALARRVQAHYDGVDDLRARFEQTTESVTLGARGSAALEARGHVVLAKPGRMRWSYESPEKSLVVSDGRTLWLFDPAAGEVQRLEVTQTFLSGAAIQFLLGEGRILESFSVTSPDCGETAPDEPVQLELRPREPATYERLVLVTDPGSGAVQETRVTDLFGNVTRVRLEEVEINQGADPSLFRFEPPEGVRVIELEP